MIWPTKVISLEAFKKLYPNKKGVAMIRGRITKINGEYWLKIKHAGLKVMFQLIVRGKVASIALEEISSRQNEFLPDKLKSAMGELEDVACWGRAVKPIIGDALWGTLLKNVENIVDKYTSETD